MFRADTAAVELAEPLDRLNSFLLGLNNASRNAILDNLGYGATPERDNWGTACHRFNHHQAKRLRPVDRKQQSRRAGKEVLLGLFVDLTGELDLIAID